MRRLMTVGLVAALGLASCSFSDVDPDATVVISGRALDASGAPLGNTKVLLVKSADIGEVVFGAVLAVGTLGTVCLVPEPPAICREAQTATTAADGSYEFEVTGEDTQGTLGTEATLNIVFTGADGVSTTTVSFAAKDTEVRLPEARTWDAAAAVTASGAEIRVGFAPLPPTAGGDPSYTAQLYAPGQEAAAWSQPASAGEAVIDARILEDRAATVAVGATTELAGGSNAGTVRAHHLSAQLPVTGSAGAPPSRGATCAAVTGVSPTAVLPAAPCGATDGELAAPARLSADTGDVVTGVVLDLGSTRGISLVVVRGVAGGFLVELSGDGTTFAPVATQLGTGVAVAPPPGSTARFVRVRSTTGLDQALLGEISVW